MLGSKGFKSKLLISLFGMTALALLAGCAMPGEGMKAGQTYQGTPTSIGQGEARSFVTFAADGHPTVIGIMLSEKALVGLPSNEHEYEYSLPLPPEFAGTGYQQVVLDWNPHGHPPEGIYDRPHFDFHFYMIDAADRKKITAVGDDLARAHKAPPAEHMPAGYILPPGTEIPNMGAHAVDPQGDEFTKHSFTKTFIYGFYDGQMIFVEPMITKAYLETKPDFHTGIAQPKEYSLKAYYPDSYGVVFDQASREYKITLEGLAMR